MPHILIETQHNDHRYSLKTKNDKAIGCMLRDVDGDFYFWPTGCDECWPSYLLREIAERLEEKNKGNE